MKTPPCDPKARITRLGPEVALYDSALSPDQVLAHYNDSPALEGEFTDVTEVHLSGVGIEGSPPDPLPFPEVISATIAALKTHPSNHPDFHARLEEERRIRLQRLADDGDRDHYE